MVGMFVVIVVIIVFIVFGYVRLMVVVLRWFEIF